MDSIRDPLLIFALALNFFTLGVSRIRAAINAVALQGVMQIVTIIIMARFATGI